jgi:hypothetical protein
MTQPEDLGCVDSQQADIVLSQTSEAERIKPLGVPDLLWPQAGLELIIDLSRQPDGLGLITGADSGDVLEQFAELLGSEILHVGRELTRSMSMPTAGDIQSLLTGHHCLTGMEILFDPVLGLRPVAVLRDLARRQSLLFAVWPAAAPDPRNLPHVDRQHLAGSVRLVSRRTVFADDPPFTVERFS